MFDFVAIECPNCGFILFNTDIEAATASITENTCSQCNPEQD